MTPYEVELLLHIHAIAEPHRTHGNPLWKDTIDDFNERDLVSIDKTDVNGCTLTERGQALVAMICNTPDPVTRFVDPRTEEIARKP